MNGDMQWMGDEPTDKKTSAEKEGRGRRAGCPGKIQTNGQREAGRRTGPRKLPSAPNRPKSGEACKCTGLLPFRSRESNCPHSWLSLLGSCTANKLRATVAQFDGCRAAPCRRFRRLSWQTPWPGCRWVRQLLGARRIWRSPLCLLRAPSCCQRAQRRRLLAQRPAAGRTPPQSVAGRIG